MAADGRDRMQITLTPPLRKALFEYAKALGRPASSLTTEMLVEMIPQFEGITKMALAAKSGNKAAAKRAVVHMFGDSMAQLMTMQQPELFGKPKRK
jgi:hypothetical protein